MHHITNSIGANMRMDTYRSHWILMRRLHTLAIHVKRILMLATVPGVQLTFFKFIPSNKKFNDFYIFVFRIVYLSSFDKEARVPFLLTIFVIQVLHYILIIFHKRK